jgi:uncharacterized repeat protein (TIGR02543 family)
MVRLYGTPLDHTVTFMANGGDGLMAAQVANATTALSTNTFSRSGYTFKEWNTAADGSGASFANGATYSFNADLTLYAQWTYGSAPAVAQVPRNRCVTATRLPRQGTAQLMKRGCVTNAGNRPGVRFKTSARSDLRYFTLFCKVSSSKNRAAQKNQSGAYCKTGSLRIRTYGKSFGCASPGRHRRRRVTPVTPRALSSGRRGSGQFSSSVPLPMLC